MKTNKLILLASLIIYSFNIIYSQNDFKFDTSPTRIKGHRTSVGSVEFSPDGKNLATCGGKNQIIIFNAANGQQVAATEEGVRKPINFLSYNYDGSLLASAGYNKGVQIWDSKTLKEISSINGFGEFSDIRFSPVENTIAVLGAYTENDNEFSVTIHNTTSGKQIREFYTALASNSYASCVDFSPDGTQLAVGFSNKDKGIRIWDVNTGTLIKHIKHTHDVTDLSFSPDGKYIAGGGIDNNVNIWEVSSGTRIHKLTGLNDYVGVVKYSPNGKYVVAGGSDNDSKFKMWETATGKLIQSEEEGGPDINSLDFSPDGQSLAMGLRTYGNAFDVATIYIYRTPEATKNLPWFEFSSNESKTMLEFPSKPEHSVSQKGSYAYHNITLDNGSTIFSFYGAQYLFAINDQKRESAIQSRINHYSPDLTNIKKSTFTYNNHTGYELIGYKGDVRCRYRFIFIKDMHYQYSISSFAKQETSVEKRYMESFAIPGQGSSTVTTESLPVNNTTFKVGDRIQGNWKARGTFYRGKIGKLKGNQVYILYDDGDVEWTTLKCIKRE